MSTAEAAPAIDVGELIERSRIGPFQGVLVLLGALVALIDGFDLSAIGATIPEIARDWGVPPGSFGPAVSMGLVGVALGSMLAGPLSDRFGRRRPLIVLVAMIGLFTLANSRVSNVTELTICRFFVGMAVGGSIPTILSLVAEYMPGRVRAFLTVLMFSGAPLGGAVVNFVGGPIIERFGWHGIYIIGGLVPLVVCVALVIWLPESLRYQVLRRAPRKDVERLVLAIDPGLRLDPQRQFVVHEATVERGAVAELFGSGRGAFTLVLWLVFASTQALTFLLSGWLPTLMKEQGMTLTAALHVTTAFQLGGGLGSIFCGWASDKVRPDRVIAVMFLGAAAATPLLALSSGPLWEYYVLAAVVGLGSAGAQVCLNAYATQLYPTRIRATGIGWALGIGRLGSILSPLAVGLLLGAGVPTRGILLGASVPAFVAFAGILVVAFLNRRRPMSHASVGTVLPH